MKKTLFDYINELACNREKDRGVIKLCKHSMELNNVKLILERYHHDEAETNYIKDYILCKHKWVITCTLEVGKDNPFFLPYRPIYEELFLIEWEEIK